MTGREKSRRREKLPNIEIGAREARFGKNMKHISRKRTNLPKVSWPWIRAQADEADNEDRSIVSTTENWTVLRYD